MCTCRRLHHFRSCHLRYAYQFVCITQATVLVLLEPRYERTGFFAYAKTKSYREADQRFCFRYMDSTIPLLPKSEISSLLPSPMAVQPGLCWTSRKHLRTKVTPVYIATHFVIIEDWAILETTKMSNFQSAPYIKFWVHFYC